MKDNKFWRGIGLATLVGFAVLLIAASPSFTGFNANQFGTDSSSKVWLKSGAPITNATIQYISPSDGTGNPFALPFITTPAYNGVVGETHNSANAYLWWAFGIASNSWQGGWNIPTTLNIGDIVNMPHVVNGSPNNTFYYNGNPQDSVIALNNFDAGLILANMNPFQSGSGISFAFISTNTAGGGTADLTNTDNVKIFKKDQLAYSIAMVPDAAIPGLLPRTALHILNNNYRWALAQVGTVDTLVGNYSILNWDATNVYMMPTWVGGVYNSDSGTGVPWGGHYGLMMTKQTGNAFLESNLFLAAGNLIVSNTHGRITVTKQDSTGIPYIDGTAIAPTDIVKATNFVSFRKGSPGLDVAGNGTGPGMNAGGTAQVLYDSTLAYITYSSGIRFENNSYVLNWSPGGSTRAQLGAPAASTVSVNDSSGTVGNGILQCATIEGGCLMTANTTSNVTYNALGECETVYNTSGSLQAAVTINLPTVTKTGQIIRYVTAGIATAATTTGGTVDVGAAITTLAANASIAYQADTANGHFVRIQ